MTFLGLTSRGQHCCAFTTKANLSVEKTPALLHYQLSDWNLSDFCDRFVEPDHKDTYKHMTESFKFSWWCFCRMRTPLPMSFITHCCKDVAWKKVNFLAVSFSHFASAGTGWWRFGYKDMMHQKSIGVKLIKTFCLSWNIFLGSQALLGICEKPALLSSVFHALIQTCFSRLIEKTSTRWLRTWLWRRAQTNRNGLTFSTWLRSND